GRELGQLVSDFIWYLRNIMLLKASDLDADTLEVSEEELLELGRMSRKISEETLLRYIRVFSELSGRIRYANDKRVLLEMAFIKLIRPETEYNLDSVLNRLEILEKKLAQGYVASSASSVGQYAGEAAGGGQHAETDGISGKNDGERIGKGADLDGQNPGTSVLMGDPGGKPESREISVPADQMGRYEVLRGSWGKIVNSLMSRSARIALQKSEIEPDQKGSGFSIVFFEEKYYAIGARTPYLTAIKEAAQQITGIDCEFRFELRQDGTPGRFISDEQLKSVFKGIEIEDE
ncbi:MAG: hypothetical protein ACI4D3_06060, partial [Lachnospiraceae bacterium]